MRRIAIMLCMCVVMLVHAGGAALAEDPFAAYQKGDYAAALKGFEELAAKGNPNAMNNLGMMLANGLGVKADHQTALQWYQKAASAGHIGAINNLGVAYEMGQGTAQNFAEAAKWYRIAADNGLSDAQYNLAALYEAGNGVPNDPVQSYVWFSLAAQHGDPDAAAGRDRMAKVIDPTLRGQADGFVKSWKPAQQAQQ